MNNPERSIYLFLSEMRNKKLKLHYVRIARRFFLGEKNPVCTFQQERRMTGMTKLNHSIPPRLPYFLLVGGVLSVRGDQFLQLNGYSNMYWGWGGEDDDMGYR